MVGRHISPCQWSSLIFHTPFASSNPGPIRYSWVSNRADIDLTSPRVETKLRVKSSQNAKPTVDSGRC